jgi:hypothetical protein
LDLLFYALVAAPPVISVIALIVGVSQARARRQTQRNAVAGRLAALSTEDQLAFIRRLIVDRSIDSDLEFDLGHFESTSIQGRVQRSVASNNEYILDAVDEMARRLRTSNGQTPELNDFSFQYGRGADR